VADPQHFGYLVDLRGLGFDEIGGDLTSWVQAAPIGSWNHPEYGKIEFTPDRIQRFASNVNGNVRGQELDIDYDHKERSGEAAGWVQKAEARPNGLWLQVKWTQAAAEKIRSGAYRYFSPEFVDEWEHPQGGKYHDVLFGGGLTNRPFLKGILPVNLSEMFTKQGGEMTQPTDPAATIAAIAEAFGLPKDATHEQVLGAVQHAQAVKQAQGTGEGEGEGEGQTQQVAQTGQTQQTAPAVAASEAQLKQLAESSPLIAKMLADHEAMQKAFAEQQKQLKLTETRSRVKALSEGKSHMLVPAAEEAAVEVMAILPTDQAKKFEELLGTVIGGKATVELGERGYNPSVGEGKLGGSNGDALKKFNEAVEKAQVEKKLSYSDATRVIEVEHPDLYTEYMNELMGAK
jgi:phage I-like protein